MVQYGILSTYELRDLNEYYEARVLRTLSNHMIRQARTGDIVLVKSRKMTVRTQTQPSWLGVEGIKTTGKKYTGPFAYAYVWVKED